MNTGLSTILRATGSFSEEKSGITSSEDFLKRVVVASANGRALGLKGALYLYLIDLMFSKRCKYKKTAHFYGWPFHTINR